MQHFIMQRFLNLKSVFFFRSFPKLWTSIKRYLIALFSVLSWKCLMRKSVVCICIAYTLYVLLRFQKNSLIWTGVYNLVWQLHKGLAVNIAFKYVLIVKYTLDSFFIRKLFSSVLHKCYLLYWRHCLTEARHILYICRYVYV